MCVQIQSNACSDCAQHLKQFRQTKNFELELKPIFYGLGLRLYWTTRRGIQSDRLRCSCLYFETSQAAHAMLRTDWNASSHLQWTKQTLDCAHFVLGKICRIQCDQAFETLGFASLQIYYWSRMKLATFPWERKMQENSFKFSDPTPAVTMPNWKFGFQRGVTLQYRPHCGRGALDERKLRGASQRCIPHNPNLIL